MAQHPHATHPQRSVDNLASRPVPQFKTPGQKGAATPATAAKNTAAKKAKAPSKAKAKPTAKKTKKATTPKKRSAAKVPALPSTKKVFPNYTRFQQNMWNHVNATIAKYAPELEAQRRRDISTAIMQLLIKNHYVNPPERQAFVVKEYDGMTPEQIAAVLDNSSAATLRRVNDSFIPNIATTIALIEQGWLRIPQLTDKGYAVLKALDERSI